MPSAKSNRKSVRFFRLPEAPLQDRTVIKPPKSFTKRDWLIYADQDIELSGTTYCLGDVQWVEACFVDGKMVGECRWFKDGELLSWRQDAETCSE